MRTILNDQVIYFDVDQTLVDHLYQSPEESMEIGVDGILTSVKPIQMNIDMMKLLKSQGMAIVVWSQGGYRWAEAVVKALGLESYVDLVITKPKMYFDDLDCRSFMGERKFGFREKMEK